MRCYARIAFPEILYTTLSKEVAEGNDRHGNVGVVNSIPQLDFHHRILLALIGHLKGKGKGKEKAVKHDVGRFQVTEYIVERSKANSDKTR
jgi:hypothetical protein